MNRTVAFLDILGFRAMVEKESSEVLGHRLSKANELLTALIKPFVNAKGEPAFFPELSSVDTYCEKQTFSDSIILISNSDTEKDCLALLIYALRITQYMIASKMPVRGGVAYGELYLNHNQNVVAGKALTRAYDLEQQQDWIGVAIDDSVVQRFPGVFSEGGDFYDVRRCLFPEYEVPMKRGPVRKFRTLNWRWNLIVVDGTRSLFEIPDDWSARSKIEAALRYALFMRGEGRAYPSDRRSTPVEVREFFIGKGNPPKTPPPHGDEY